MSKENFPALTGIRAVAAFMVYIHHRNPFDEVFFGKKIHDFFGEFHVGVTIFFVLSGFLITYLMLREQEGKGVFVIKNFYAR